MAEKPCPVCGQKMCAVNHPVNGPVTETLDFRLGYQAGYAARVKEELADYLGQIKAGHAVYDRVIRDLVELPTSAERKAAREATLREAHAAELHADGPAYGCPVCEEARTVVRQCPRCGAGPYATEEWLQGHMNEECPARNAESDRHHSGSYGVDPDASMEAHYDAEMDAQPSSRGCRQELCPNWPGEGCVRGVMDCETQNPEVSL